MRVVCRLTKDGFKVVEASKIRIDDEGTITVTTSVDEFNVPKHKSWDRAAIDEYLESVASLAGPINLSHLARPLKDWKATGGF